MAKPKLPLHPQPAAVLDRPGALPLARVAPPAGPEKQTDDPPVVADQEATARCYYCGAVYQLGPAVGTLFIHYPDAEYRYWGHCLTNQHQRALDILHTRNAQHLQQLDAVMSDAKRHQADARNPVLRALQEILR